KAGHAFSSYWIGRWAQGLTSWAGLDARSGAWIGFATANLFLGGVELLDGHSSAWGFSPWDMVANLAGSGVFLGQELGWGEQKVKLKYSSWPTELAEERPELLGASFGERILKDYNGQTIWATMAWGAVRPRSHWTDAFGLALGYGADGMLTADPDRTSSDEVVAGQDRYRQYLVSLDVDLERIPTRSKAVRTALFLLNCIKVPAPAVEFRSNGRVLMHGLYF
ncbi:MAG: DUF2279 domain-containing protein, partial [Verrucomicrobiae bacterium]|nr:DUF2279 domain-containing protein [Verrucomicrobiae bacterium]